jgi:glutamate/tyrosine decarboxylase-like PLP-dependent enzyme
MAERDAPLEMDAAAFREAGHALVDRIAAFLESLPSRTVTRGEAPADVRRLLPEDRLPDRGRAAKELLEEASALLFDHSLFNGHPRFWGYITSSAAPIGALADLLAAAVNPNCGAWVLSPAATEIEAQTIRWIAELIGYPRDCGGLLVSGGNMGNMVGFVAARRARVPWDVRALGVAGSDERLAVYASKEAHTWVQKATDLFGLGTAAIRWIDTDARQAMLPAALEAAIAADVRDGRIPLLVVGTAGSVSTGAIDPLREIGAICRRLGIWLHVDGAYGAFAAALPEAPADLKALSDADSVALDPHKWLYAPLEAGCALVRDPRHLSDAFGYHPAYYAFHGEGAGASASASAPLNYYELGPQNSRGFRALKVWLGLRQAGREGYVRMIRDDIALATALDAVVRKHAELEAMSLSLSIATFRYVPAGLPGRADTAGYLDDLNRAIVERLQSGGEAFVSNAVVDGKQALRACVVNFRTTRADVEALPEIVARIGRAVDRERRP